MSNQQQQQLMMMSSNNLMMNQQFIAVPPTTLLRSTSSSYGDSVLFPWKLHQMLDAAHEEGFSSVVSWLDDNQSFKVHDKNTFVSFIMPKYFEEQTKYKSFQRQLNMWGFERFLVGDNKGGYGHKAGLFVRGNKQLCCRMNRLKKTDRKSKPTTTTTQPTKATTTVITPVSKKNTKRISMDLEMMTTLPPTMMTTRAVSSDAVSVEDSDNDLDNSNHTTSTSSVAGCSSPNTTGEGNNTDGQRRPSVIVEFLLSEIEDVATSKNSQQELDDSWHELFPSLDLLNKYSP